MTNGKGKDLFSEAREILVGLQFFSSDDKDM